MVRRLAPAGAAEVGEEEAEACTMAHRSSNPTARCMRLARRAATTTTTTGPWTKSLPAATRRTSQEGEEEGDQRVAALAEGKVAVPEAGAVGAGVATVCCCGRECQQRFRRS